MIPGRISPKREVIGVIKEAYSEEIRIFKDAIPHSVRAAETSATGKSIFTHDPNGRVAAAYAALTGEVLEVA